MSQESPVVSIIIVTHNSRPCLAACLSRLPVGSPGQIQEIILIDNGSTDDTPSLVRQQFPDIRVVPNSENIGFGRACNQGAAMAIGKYLLFLNPDVAVDADAVSELVLAIRGTNTAGLVSGRLRSPDGSFQANCRNFPDMRNLFFSRGSALRRLPGFERLEKALPYTRPDYKQITIVPAVSGTMVMVRRSLFDRMGGFDERFFLFLEDTDLSYRLNRAEYVNLFVPRAGGVHEWGTGSRVGKIRRNWHLNLSMWKYMLLRRGYVPALWLLPLLLLCNFMLSCTLPDRRNRSR